MASRSPRATRVPGVQTHDRRFRRARGKGERTRRQIWVSRLWLALRVGVVTSVLAAAGVFGHGALTASEAFTVQDIRVHGNQRLSIGEVSMLLDGLRGRNVLVTALDPWRDRLLSSPWVKDAALRRVVPGAIEVTIEERRPVAIARAGRTLQLIDAEGAVIDQYGPRYESLDLPLLQGLDLFAEGGPDAARLTLALAALDELAAAGLLWRVSEIDVARPHDAVVTLNDEPTLLRLGAEQFADRLQSYLDMSRRLRAMASDLEYVDLRFGDRVYIRPRRAGVNFALASTPAASAAEGDEPVEADVIPDDPSVQE